MNSSKRGNYRWSVCTLLFFATTVNYLDRQVLSLTWKDFISPEFHWTNSDYGLITALFSIFYAVSMLFAGPFVDWLDTKKGFLWAIGIWSVGAVLHAFCGIATSGIVAGERIVGLEGAVPVNFPAAINAAAEYLPERCRALSTSIFEAGATVGALAAPLIVPVIAAYWGRGMSFIIIGALGFIWMGFWVFMYKKPHEHPKVNAAELEYIMQDGDDDELLAEALIPVVKKKMSLRKCLKYKQTWAFAFGKFMTDGVWWFFLF